MVQDLRIIVAQINTTVGDFTGNRQKIEQVWREQDSNADLIIYPEMVLSGYPVEDLVLRPAFIERAQKEIDAIIEHSKQHSSAILIGAPWKIDDSLYNAAFLIDRGKVSIILKHGLPNYGVFDEKRIFEHGPFPVPTSFRGRKLGIMICWDFWSPEASAHLKEKGAEILIIPNGSTYEITKIPARLHEAEQRVRETGLPVLYVNMIGGQDELIFDGTSFYMNEQGEVTFMMKAFEEHIALVQQEGDPIPYPEIDKAIYSACVLGLRDYVEKNNISGVLLGLSGGIDSALAAIMAVDAFGSDRVKAYRLPSPFTSTESMADAQALAEKLGIFLGTIPIEGMMKAYEEAIEGLSGLAHENIQARIRGGILMSLSNMSGDMLLSTGNKSEVAVGYSTLYGDMCGGFNPLKDLYKQKVFALSHLRNRWKPDFVHGSEGPLIPADILTKAPTAELREGQLDQDSLPPYEELDQILEALIENERSIDDIADAGFSKDMVEKVYRLLKLSEYKRRQAAPGVNVTTKSFGGRSRRYPIVNKFSE